MAWRPYENLIEGELDNRKLGQVTGWLDFYRSGKKPIHVFFDLAGDFHRDIAGYRVRLQNQHEPADRQPGYMDGFALRQRGVVGDMTAGRPVDGEVPYVPHPYFEWYAENGRVVLEQLEVAILDGTLRQVSPKEIAEQQRRREQAMQDYLTGMARAIGGIRPDARSGPGPQA